MSDEHAVAAAIIRLMQGVVYRESDEDTWVTLERSGAGVRDHFATIGVDVVVDDRSRATPTFAPARRSTVRRRCRAWCGGGR